MLYERDPKGMNRAGGEHPCAAISEISASRCTGSKGGCEGGRGPPTSMCGRYVCWALRLES